MPQQLDATVSTCRSGTSRSVFSRAGITPNAFWWQWPCRSARPAAAAQTEVDARLAGGAGDQLLEQHESGVTRLALEAEHQRLVAEREQARRLQADDGDSPLDERCERRERAGKLLPGLADEAGGQERPPAAQRAAFAGRRRGGSDPVPRRLQHPYRGAGVLGLEPGGEGVRKEHDFGSGARSGGRAFRIGVPVSRLRRPVGIRPASSGGHRAAGVRAGSGSVGRGAAVRDLVGPERVAPPAWKGALRAQPIRRSVAAGSPGTRSRRFISQASRLATGA